MENEPPPLTPATIKRLTRQEMKLIRDKGRKRSGKIHKKRVAILIHPKIKAFKGWRNEPEPWSYKTVCKYVDWCHISKLFPLCRHKEHLKQNKVNLAYSKDEGFILRCCEVWKHLYLEDSTYRNDNFCFFLVRMVYAEYVLKKEVDWSTLKEVPIAIIPETAKILPPDEPVDVKKMLSKVKRGKSFVRDESVVWSETSSSDLHTHEYDGHSFHSDEEEVAIQESRLAVDVGVDQSGQSAQEPIIVQDTDEEGMDDGVARRVDPVLREGDGSGGGSDSENEEAMLLAKIESAKLALRAKNEQLKTLKEQEMNPTFVEVLKQRLKAITNVIEENDKGFHSFKRNRDFYLKEMKSGKVHKMDHYLIWESKLETLVRKRQQAENERRSLELQIMEKKKEYYEAAVQHVPKVELLASSSTYGSVAGEVATLEKLVKFHEQRLPLMVSELEGLRAESRFFSDWYKWNRASIGKSDAELQQMGPEPILKDYLNTK
jgi:hypothetical protein